MTSKLCFGMSFSSYLEQRRMARACELLKDGVAVKETAEKVGYCSDYSFRRAFKRVLGIPPAISVKCRLFRSKSRIKIFQETNVFE
ncbi:MAG: helix-turn-helix domain-containing protein [Lachnospiraceae bacterium]